MLACCMACCHTSIHDSVALLPVLPVLPHGLAMELLMRRGHVSYVLLPPRAHLPIYRLVRYLCRLSSVHASVHASVCTTDRPPMSPPPKEVSPRSFVHQKSGEVDARTAARKHVRRGQSARALHARTALRGAGGRGRRRAAALTVPLPARRPPLAGALGAWAAQ